MALDIGETIRTGFDRTTARNGLLFAGIFFVLGALNVLLSNSIARSMMPPGGFGAPMGGPMGGAPVRPTLGLSPVVSGVRSASCQTVVAS